MLKLRRNTSVSIFAGILFAIGWWFMIDASCQYSRSIEFKKSFHLIGIVGTIALLLANSISNSQIHADALNKNCLGVFGARLFLFFSFLFLFGSLITSAWVLFGYYISSKQSTFYPGLAIFIQNLAIFISTLLLKLARKDDVD